MESGDATPPVHPSSPSSGETLVIESESPPSSVNNNDSCSADNTPSTSGSTASMSSGSYPIRKRRNPAVLIRWIEEHPFNPYPTKGEKQGLAFYAGMTQRQLNDWFANARRNIKKVGYENWKKKHNGFSAILSGMPTSNNCSLSFLSSTATSTSNGNSNNGGGGGGHGLNSAFTSSPFPANTAFTIARPSFNVSTPCSVMSYSPNSTNPMSLGSMATCVKPTPLPSSGFVKVEGAGTYYGGSYAGLTHASADNTSPLPSTSVCLSSLPFSHESYQLTTGHTQAATGQLLAVDANIRQFSAPATATIPYIPCDCTPTATSATTLPNPTILYNWTHQPMPMGSTTVLNHASFGLMSAQTPPPPPTPSQPQQQCATTPSNETCSGNSQSMVTGGAADSLQNVQEQENTSSPHESGYYSSTTSPAPNHPR